ncbi:hypothetical protein L218DRAFT_650537 [Marasmius fiardii PR-910]|nr:hypothetical protein L218DRAFT_650537 [Marasmius fiardii PR-910]
MLSLFSKLKDRAGSSSKSSSHNPSSEPPPEWAPAQEPVHQWGLYNEAPEEDYQTALNFCNRYPLNRPRLLPSNALDVIKREGSRAWGIQLPTLAESRRFSGRITNINRDTNPTSKGAPGPQSQAVITVETDERCGDFCLMSDLPIIPGLYDVSRQSGVYFEVKIVRMFPPDSYLAIGTACQPYPNFRLPGWNRESAGFHLDDLRKFFEDSDGGRDYSDTHTHRPLPFTRINPRDTIGCGYEFSTASLFYTWNGVRLDNAFSGIYLPRNEYDVFAAVGVHGATKFEVNFGGDVFRWKEGNEWGWRVEEVVGRGLGAGWEGGGEEPLPAYS